MCVFAIGMLWLSSLRIRYLFSAFRAGYFKFRFSFCRMCLVQAAAKAAQMPQAKFRAAVLRAVVRSALFLDFYVKVDMQTWTSLSSGGLCNGANGLGGTCVPDYICSKYGMYLLAVAC